MLLSWLKSCPLRSYKWNKWMIWKCKMRSWKKRTSFSVLKYSREIFKYMRITSSSNFIQMRHKFSERKVRFYFLQDIQIFESKLRTKFLSWKSQKKNQKKKKTGWVCLLVRFVVGGMLGNIIGTVHFNCIKRQFENYRACQYRMCCSDKKKPCKTFFIIQSFVRGLRP